MIIRDKDQEVLEIEMFHKVYVGKNNAIANFNQYLQTLQMEFEQELTRHLYGVKLPENSGNSHIIVP